jgi:hypothetical protein
MNAVLALINVFRIRVRVTGEFSTLTLCNEACRYFMEGGEGSFRSDEKNMYMHVGHGWKDSIDTNIDLVRASDIIYSKATTPFSSRECGIHRPRH